jgi:hypothetical protein
MLETEESQAEHQASENVTNSLSDLSVEHTSSMSPAEKMATEDSVVPPENYEMTRRKRKSNRNRSSEVQLGSYESESKDDALTNGLDPIGIELISSTTISSTKTESEYSEKSIEDIGSTKISREMRNLQKSTNDSKILTDYLTTTHESPRSRRRTPALQTEKEQLKESEPEIESDSDVIEGLHPDDLEIVDMEIDEEPQRKEEHEEEEKVETMEEVGQAEEEVEEAEEAEEEGEEEEEEEEDMEDEVQESFKEDIVVKQSPQSSHNDGFDSESTTVLPMEPPNKRRKSFSRSRSRSIFRSRQKSVAQQMKDEMSVTSDKEETQDDEDDDRTSETSFVTRRSIDGRPVNPPPKVSPLNRF